MLKRNTILILIKVLLILGILFFYLTGCGPEKLSIAERISAFMEGINASGSRDGVQAHIHPDASNYAATADGTFWDSPFLSGDNFVLDSLTISGSTAETTIDSDSVYNDDPIQFEMKEQETDNWFIIGIKIDTDTPEDGYDPDDVVLE